MSKNFIRHRLPLTVAAIYCLFALLISSFFGCDGCANVTFNVILGQDNQAVLKQEGQKVVVCPGQPITLGWHLSSDVTAATIVPDVGAVSGTEGVKTVVPTADTVYRIHTQGRCQGSAYVEVFVVKPNVPVTTQAMLVDQNALIWQAVLLPDYFDPHMTVNKVSLGQPPTKDGWNTQVLDLKAKLQASLLLTNQAQAPASPLPLVGTWRFTPKTPDELRSVQTGEITLNNPVYFQALVTCKTN
jgi:hypothetical protein